jgi:rare lipoprotein A (peptidoglycan hydrolase)
MISYIFSLILTIFNLNFEQSYNKIGYVQKGVASYYADDFHGKKTANGEKFDMNTLTAAHPRIRFNTMLKVTNLTNGKSINVRVNDRGPYVGGRILDLSRAAAQKIDMIRNGTAEITAEVIAIETLPTIEEIAKNKPQHKETADKTTDQVQEMKRKTKIGGLLAKIKDALVGKTPTKTEEPTEDEPQPKKEVKKLPTKMENPTEKTTTEPILQPKNTSKTQPKQTTILEDIPKPKPVRQKTDKADKMDKAEPIEKVTPNHLKLNESNFLAMNTYNVWGTEKFPDGYGVQIGSYTDFVKAMEIAKGVQQTYIANAYLQVGMSGEKKVYRIVAGEGTADNAKTLIAALKEQGYAGVFMKQHY